MIKDYGIGKFRWFIGSGGSSLYCRNLFVETNSKRKKIRFKEKLDLRYIFLISFLNFNQLVEF